LHELAVHYVRHEVKSLAGLHKVTAPVAIGLDVDHNHPANGRGGKCKVPDVEINILIS
jgi:hypothetical protein